MQIQSAAAKTAGNIRKQILSGQADLGQHRRSLLFRI
jgi:hypothetical protein